MIPEKLLSARFWMTMFFSITACVGFLMKLLPSEAFVGLVAAVVAHYFNRQRAEEKNGHI